VRVGIDSYAYHRLLGEVRPGEEEPPRAPFPGGYEGVIAEAQRLGVDLLSLETNVLPPPAEVDVAALRERTSPAQLVLAHGHPQGLRFGRDAQQAADLQAWITGAADAGLPLVRMVLGGPFARLDEPSSGFLPRVLDALRPPVALAGERGVALALENHADLTLDEMEQVLDELDAPHLGVCFDTSNWVRVGDDPAEAARRLAGRVRVVHLKDHVARPDDGLVGPRAAALGAGEVDLAGVLDPLLAAEPGLPVCVELGHLGPGVDEVDMVERGVAWLRAEAARREAVAKGG
jgi:sugar phosphate isomerase/epimerase